MYLIPVSCPRYPVAVQLVIADKTCAEGFYNKLVECAEVRGWRISPIREVDQTEASDLIDARSEAEAAFVYYVVQYLQTGKLRGELA
jgi:hypothetical protein